MTDTWALVHAERRALIDDLACVSDEQWEADSWAQGWTVHDVAAHLVDNARTTPWRLARAMARARFDFDRQNANGVAAEKGPTPADTLERLRQVADRTSGPPTCLAALESRLVEEIAHGEDIRRPLGIVRTYPSEAVRAAIGYQVRTPESFGGAQKLASRVRLEADDADLAVGSGPEVRGPALELLMLVSGRRPREGSLTGPGLALL